MGREILEETPPAADHRMAYGADPNQFGELRLPPGGGPHPVVVSIHGGFWRDRFDLKHMGHLAAVLKQRGIATWNIEYRRIGQPGGGWPGTGSDVLAGYHHLSVLARTYPLDLKRVVVIGFSAGGHLALWLASRSRQDQPTLKAAISLAGVADLEHADRLQLSSNVVRDFLPGPPDQFPDASPARLAIEPPQILFHGEKDDVVPVAIAREYARLKQSRKERVRLHEFPNAGHFELIDPSATEWGTIEKAIVAVL